MAVSKNIYFMGLGFGGGGGGGIFIDGFDELGMPPCARGIFGTPSLW